MDNKELYKDNIRDSHWIGEVVDNADPSNLGRCRVKVFGKFDQLPNEAIPWATPMNRDQVGAHSVPRVGDIVAIRFDNGNIYHPEYWFQVNQNTDLKSEVLDNSSAAQNVVSLVYDAERNVRIFWSPEDGLTMTTGEDKDEAPAIRFSNDGKIYLHSDNIFIASSNNDESEPAVRGETLSKLISKMLGFIKTHTHASSSGSPTTPPLPPVSLDIELTKLKLDQNIGEGKIKQTK
jgi:hypothetical protein